jgi:hypothetical protein
MGKLFGAAIVVLVLGLGLFLWMNQGGKDTEVGNKEGEMAPQASSVPVGENKVLSIQEAMGLGGKMVCSFSSEGSGTAPQTKVFVDGVRFKSVSQTGGVTAYALFDGSTQYTWTSNDNKGLKIEKSCLEEAMKGAEKLTQSMPNTDDAAFAPTDASSALGAAGNMSCVRGGAEADFSVPSDIFFADQCALIKQSMEMMEQLKGQIPTGMRVPGMPPAR